MTATDIILIAYLVLLPFLLIVGLYESPKGRRRMTIRMRVFRWIGLAIVAPLLMGSSCGNPPKQPPPTVEIHKGG